MAKKNNQNQTDIKTQDFETSILTLEEIIKKMESSKLTLEDGLSSFEKGIALTNHCQSLLANAQQKVQILINEQEKKFQDFDLDKNPES